MKYLLMTVIALAVILAYRAIYQIIKQSVKEYRDSLELFEPEKKWNSFEGYATEQDQINETKDRC